MFCMRCGASIPAGAGFCPSCGAPVQPIPVAPAPVFPPPAPFPSAAPAPSGPVLAHMGDRVIALVLDAALLAAMFALGGMGIAVRMGGLTESGFSMQGGPALAAIGVTMLCGFLYVWLLEGLWGVTLGKAIVGIAVSRTDGRPCGLGPSLVRNLLRLVDGIAVYLVGFLVAMFSRFRQRVGDHLAGTIVVERKTGAGARVALVAVWLVSIVVCVAGAVLVHRGAGAAASGGLRAINLAFLASPGGPERPAGPYKPGETVYLKFDVTGFTTDPQGRVDLLLRWVARDPSGLALHAPVERGVSQTMAAGAPVNASFHVELPAFVPPGKYQIESSVEDRVKNNTLRFAPAFQVQAPALAPAARLEIRDFAFSLSRDGPPAEPAVLQGGGTIYSRFSICGIQFREDRADVRVGLKVIGPGRNEVLDEPNYVTLADSFVYRPPAFFLPITGHLNLPANVAKGVYTARYLVADNVAQAAVEHAAQFEVR